MKRALRNLQRDLAIEGKAKTLNRLYWQQDRQRINQQPIPQGEGYAKPDTEITLRAQNDYFTAGAIFRRKDGIWSVTECAPILHWLRKTPFDSIKTELLKRGCSWEWLPVSPPTDSLRIGDKHDSITITSRTEARPAAKSDNTASTSATGETQGRGKLLDQELETLATSSNSKCSPVPS